MDGSPPARTFPLYGDELYLTRADGSTTANSGAVTVPSNGGGFWTDPLHPWSKVRLLHDLRTACTPPAGVVLVGQSGRARPADSTALEVNDAKYPAGAFNRRKSARQSIVVGTMTAADQVAVETLHDSGAPLFLQLDPRQKYTDGYGLCGDLSVEPLAGNWEKPWRVISTPYVEQLAPVGPAEGTLKSRYADYNKYASFEAVMSAGGSTVDRFARTVAAGSWGSTPNGLAWTLSNPSDGSVAGGVGVLVVPVANTTRRASILSPTLSLADIDVTVDIAVAAAPAGAAGQIDHAIRVRFAGVNDFVDLRIFRRVNTNDITVAVRQVIAGVESAVSAFPAVPGATAGSPVTARLVAKAGSVQGWAWVTGGRQPVTPLVTTTVTLVAAGGLDLYSATNASVTNVPYTTTFDNLEAVNLAGGPTWLDGLRGGLTV
jgi:hypothetical protein